MVRLSLLLLGLPTAIAYSSAAVNSLNTLATNINSTTTYINTLEGCGYKNTTEAISEKATVQDGSACPAADRDITEHLNSIAQALQSSIKALAASRSNQEASSAQVLDSFQQFANSFYILFNAMDLAECTYILTTQSQAFAAQFSQPDNLTAGFNGLVAELSHDLGLAVQLLGPNLKQQTHFGGTSLLAAEVDGPTFFALAGCKLITSIVESEGGGSG